jgi:hypothetical protein
VACGIIAHSDAVSSRWATRTLQFSERRLHPVREHQSPEIFIRN